MNFCIQCGVYGDDSDYKTRYAEKRTLRYDGPQLL